MLRILALVCLAALAGCATAGFNRALEYPHTLVRVQMPDDTYRVFEHPSENTIMTTSSIGRAIGVGAARGATFGLANPNSPEQRHEAAARQYLAQTGRQDCTIVSGYLLIQPQYEFTFQCPSRQARPAEQS